MAELGILAEAFNYPFPRQVENWASGLGAISESRCLAEYAAFLQALQPLSQGELEELHTRTLDLDPEFAPYFGFQMWGDSYQRGNLMSLLNEAMQRNQIDLGGELPDHLIPVLRYLDRAAEPIPELVQVFEPALEKMILTLTKRDATNPYLHLLRAVLSCSGSRR